jgi:hypothetical protein
MKKYFVAFAIAFCLLFGLNVSAYASPVTTDNAQTVPIDNTRFWSGTGYGGGGICIENRTEWQTWRDRLYTASTEMSRAASWYSTVGDGIGSCSSRPSQYQIRVYRFSDSSQGCWHVDADAAWSSQGFYYYTNYVVLWLNTASSDCGIVPANTNKQARAVSTALMSIACCKFFNGGSTYSVLNLDRENEIFWPTWDDRDGLDTRY